MISYERKNNLKSLSVDIKALLSSSNYANLNFICTHTSGNIYLSWAQTAATLLQCRKCLLFSEELKLRNLIEMQ